MEVVKFEIKNIHAGIKSDEIIELIQNLNKNCKSNKLKTILFLDQINTNENIPGIF